MFLRDRLEPLSLCLRRRRRRRRRLRSRVLLLSIFLHFSLPFVRALLCFRCLLERLVLDILCALRARALRCRRHIEVVVVLVACILCRLGLGTHQPELVVRHDVVRVHRHSADGALEVDAGDAVAVVIGSSRHLDDLGDGCHARKLVALDLDTDAQLRELDRVDRRGTMKVRRVRGGLAARGPGAATHPR